MAEVKELHRAVSALAADHQCSAWGTCRRCDAQDAALKLLTEFIDAAAAEQSGAESRERWAVRVLDAWEAADEQHYHHSWASSGGCVLLWTPKYQHTARTQEKRKYGGPTPDAARIAAAEALYAEDPTLPAPPEPHE